MKSICAAVFAAFAASTAFAGRYWVCNTDDARFSNTSNWSESQNGAGGASKPGDGATGTTYFYTYKNGRIVFDELPTLPGDVRVGTKSDDYFVWSATDPSFGLFGTNRSVQVGDKISGVCTPTRLKVDGGTYSFNYARIGYESGGTAELLIDGGSFSCYKGYVGATGHADGTLTVKGGTFTTTSTSTSDSMTVGYVTNSIGTVVVDGGTLVNVGYVNVSCVSNVTGLINVKSGNWTASGIRIGGKANKATNYLDHAVGRIVIDGGSVAWTNANAMTLGHAIGESSYAELVVNGGDVTCNATYFYVGETGPATFTMNGGAFTMTNTGGGNLNIGHCQTGKDVGTLVLNGGELAVRMLRVDYAQPGSKVVFNGGTLKPIKSASDFLNANTNLTCEVQAGGMVIDTAGYNVTIKHPIVLAEGVASATLVKKGAGTLTISGSTPFAPGNIFVHEGTAVVGGTTYSANAGDAIDASAGGDLGVVVTHGDTLEAWLKDPDFTTPYSSKYRAAGTNSLEQPRPVVVSVNGALRNYTNLEIGRTYSDTLNGVSYSFTTENLAPRTLQAVSASGVSTMNIRDVGSWPLVSADGTAKMNQGVIFRGANLDHFANSTAEQRAASALANLKTEIDLRDYTVDGMNAAYKDAAKSWAAIDADYVYCPINYNLGGSQVDSDANGNFTNQMRRVFSRLGTPGALPAYFHCAIGTDRTGITGLLLLGLMGVSEESLYRDYLMSNFASIGSSRSPSVPEKFILYMLRGKCNGNKYVYCDNQYGESIAARARAYLEMCGVTAEEIANITQALSGETPDQVLARVNAYEAAANVRTVSYISYPSSGTLTTNATHRLPAGQHFFPMTAPTRNGYVFTGWDTENEANGYVYATWDELHPLYWAGTNGVVESFTRGASWDPAPDGTFDPSDTLVLNKGNGKVALFSEGDATAAALYVGWGTYDGGRSFNTSRCLGGRLDVTGGTLAITNLLCIGGYSSAYSNVVNVTGGCLVAGTLRMGDYYDSKSNGKCDVLNISGGGVVSNTTGEIQLSVRSGASSRINISGGGTFKSERNVRVASYRRASVVLEDGSTMDLSGRDLYVGYHAKALGEVSVSGSRLFAKDVSIGYDASATGRVSVVGNSTLTSSHYIYVGRQGDAELTIDGGTVSVAERVQFGYSGASGNSAVINLNGGKLKTRRIGVTAAPSAVFNWNGGTLEGASGSDGNMIPANANLEVRVLEGGALYNAVVRDNEEIKEDLSGVGAFTKKGAKPLKLSGAVNLASGFVVEAGTLTLMNLTCTEFERISVAEGASLDLNGAEVTVGSYILAGTSQPAGTYSAHNGTIHVNSAGPGPGISVLDAAGYDYTNRVLTVSGAQAGVTVTLSVASRDGAPVEYAATADSEGSAVFAVRTVPGVSYSYTVSQEGAQSASGEFASGSWGNAGTWFSGAVENGEGVVSGGDWVGTPAVSADGGAIEGGAEFALDAAAVASGSNRLSRVDVRFVGDGLSSEADLGPVEGAMFGCIAGVLCSGGDKAWFAFDGLEWRRLYGDCEPRVAQPYVMRAELDASRTPVGAVRYYASENGGESFAPLFCDAGRTAAWIPCNAAASGAVTAVAAEGVKSLVSVDGSLMDANVAEADGVGYASLADALAAGGGVKLLTNATWPTNAPVGTIAAPALGGYDLKGVEFQDGRVVVSSGFSNVSGGRVGIDFAALQGLGIATADRTPAQIASDLQAQGANGLAKWESYVLGLDPSDADAKPRAGISVYGDAVVLELLGVTVNAASGATVTYRVYRALDPAGIEDAQPAGGDRAVDEAAELDKDGSNRSFYRLRVDVKGW